MDLRLLQSSLGLIDLFLTGPGFQLCQLRSDPFDPRARRIKLALRVVDAFRGGKIALTQASQSLQVPCSELPLHDGFLQARPGRRDGFLTRSV